MIKRILLLTGISLIISGCSGDPILQRSANNKLVDAKGFQGSKRRPLYNKKYIERAKQNVVYNDYDEEDDYDVDEPDEVVNPSARNRSMYRSMIDREQDMKRKKMGKKRGSYLSHLRQNDDYPDIAHARDLAKSSEREPDANLRKELDEIKSMLSSAKKDLAKYRCPMNDVEEKSAEVKTKAPSKPQMVKKPVVSKAKVLAKKHDHQDEDTNQEEHMSESRHEIAPESVHIDDTAAESEVVTHHAADEPKNPKEEPTIVIPEPIKKASTDPKIQSSEHSSKVKEEHPNISNMINVAPGSLVTK